MYVYIPEGMFPSKEFIHIGCNPNVMNIRISRIYNTAKLTCVYWQKSVRSTFLRLQYFLFREGTLSRHGPGTLVP